MNIDEQYSQALREIDRLEAENERLRDVLQEIADPLNGDLYYSKELAKDALRSV